MGDARAEATIGAPGICFGELLSAYKYVRHCQVAAQLDPRKDCYKAVCHKDPSAFLCGGVAAKYFVSVEWGSRMLREACQPGMPDLQLAHSLFTNMVGAKRVPLAPVMAIYADALRAQEPGSDRIEQVRSLAMASRQISYFIERALHAISAAIRHRAMAQEQDMGY
jgi:hypothetical protein